MRRASMWFARAEIVGWVARRYRYNALVVNGDVHRLCYYPRYFRYGCGGKIVAAKVCSIRLAWRVHGIFCIRTSHDVTHARIWTDKNLFMALTIPHIVGIVARRFSTSRKFPPCRKHTDLQSCTVIRATKVITTCCNARTMMEVNNEGMSKVQLIATQNHTHLSIWLSRACEVSRTEANCC